MLIRGIGKLGRNRLREVRTDTHATCEFLANLIVDEWWRFDDSRVTSVPESKILALDGGGEADTACRMSPFPPALFFPYVGWY
jgi:hypothetical protein